MLNQILKTEFTLSDVAEVDTSILVAVSEIQNTLGESLIALNEISQYLNNYFKDSNLVLANIFFNDFIAEAHRNDSIDEAHRNITDAIERFVAIKVIASMYEDAKESIEQGSDTNINFKDGNYVAQVNDAELAVKVGIILNNIAELTAWAYLEETDKYTGHLISGEPNEKFKQAVDILKASGSLVVTDKVLKNYRVELNQVGDRFEVKLSRPVRSLVGLHKKVEKPQKVA